ncbi:MAG: MBL fold metallo-hydrolase [Alphaproteobacteria bacterium]|nr:MBL fold metallo-hydrolase [Alphaproteobacteria bacterium]
MENKQLGTTWTIYGGNNPDNIGANCGVLLHRHSKYDRPTRIMLDCGALFAPKGADVDAVFPDIREYLGTSKSYPKIDALLLSHAHEDHIGGMVHLARAGYSFPPIYASKGTLELLKSSLKLAGVDLDKDEWKYIDENGDKKELFIEIKSREAINFKGVEIEAINMSHTTVGPLGFHILTSIDGKVEAGIFHPGDYHTRKVRVGEGFEEAALRDLASRKPIDIVFLDSTSTDSGDEYTVTHEEAVKNLTDVIKQHPEKQVITTVISSSIQNLAIHLDAARKTNRKVFIDGYRLKLAFKAMQDAGIREYDDIIFWGDANAYLKKYDHKDRYIVGSGAFAEEHSTLMKLIQQEKIVPSNDKKNKKKKKNIKKTGHPYFTIDNKTLFIFGQRGVINYDELCKAANVTSSLGAVVFVNDAKKPLKGFPTAKIQSSGHANRKESKQLLSIIAEAQNNPNEIICIPVHGNPDQLENTKKLAEEVGMGVFLAQNSDILQFNNRLNGKVAKIDELEPKPWMAVKQLDDNTSVHDVFIYYLVDNDYNITEEWKKIVQKNPRNDNSWNAINPSNNSTDEAKSSKNNRNFRKSYSR